MRPNRFDNASDIDHETRNVHMTIRISDQRELQLTRYRIWIVLLLVAALLEAGWIYKLAKSQTNNQGMTHINAILRGTTT